MLRACLLGERAHDCSDNDGAEMANECVFERKFRAESVGLSDENWQLSSLGGEVG